MATRRLVRSLSRPSGALRYVPRPRRPLLLGGCRPDRDRSRGSGAAPRTRLRPGCVTYLRGVKREGLAHRLECLLVDERRHAVVLAVTLQADEPADFYSRAEPEPSAIGFMGPTKRSKRKHAEALAESKLLVDQFFAARADIPDDGWTWDHTLTVMAEARRRQPETATIPGYGQDELRDRLPTRTRRRKPR